MKNGVINYLVSAIRKGNEFVEYFKSGKYGWKLWEENDKYTLEIDNIIVRDKLIFPEKPKQEDIKVEPIVFNEPVEVIKEEPKETKAYDTIEWSGGQRKYKIIKPNYTYKCDVEEYGNTESINTVHIDNAKQGDCIRLYGCIHPFCSLIIESEDSKDKITISTNSSKKKYLLTLEFIDDWVITNWLDLGNSANITIK